MICIDMKKTKFKSNVSFREELLDLVQNLLEDYEEISTATTVNLVTVPGDSYHFLSQLLKPPYKSTTEKILFSMLYKTIHKAEVVCANSGHIAFVMTLLLIENFLTKNKNIKNEVDVFNNLNTALDKLKYMIEKSSKSLTKFGLRNVIEDQCKNEVLSKAVEEAVNLAGLEGRIFVEDGKRNHYVVELKEGYKFPLKPYNFFLENGKWDHRQAKILVVDGFVESVSEIDQILNAAFDKKQPLVIASLGYSEEVVSTLYANHKRGNLNAIPLRLMSDINNLNVINDIGVATGRDPVSSLKGQLLTFVKFDDLPTLDRIIVTEKEVTIENPRTRGPVFEQIKALTKKREDNKGIEDVQNIMDRRIRSLCPSSVSLYLPEMSATENESCRIRIDHTLRCIKSLINYGVVSDFTLTKNLRNDYLSPLNNFDRKPTIISNEFDKTFFTLVETLQYTSKNCIKGDVSSISLYLGIKLGASLALMLVNSSGVIEFDDDDDA